MANWDDLNRELAENSRRLRAARREAQQQAKIAERWGRVALISIIIAAFLQVVALVLWCLA